MEGSGATCSVTQCCVAHVVVGAEGVDASVDAGVVGVGVEVGASRDAKGAGLSDHRDEHTLCAVGGVIMT